MSGLDSYVEIVRSASGRRRALQQLPVLETALQNGRDVAEAAAELDTALRAAQEDELPARVLTAEELLTLKLPRRERLNELVAVKDLIMVHSWRGLGKSWFSLSLALAVAHGADFLRWKAECPASVLYVDGELPAEDLRERVASLAAGMETDGSEPLRFQRPVPSAFTRVTPALGD